MNSNRVCLKCSCMRFKCVLLISLLYDYKLMRPEGSPTVCSVISWEWLSVFPKLISLSRD